MPPKRKPKRRKDYRVREGKADQGVSRDLLDSDFDEIEEAEFEIREHYGKGTDPD